MQFCSTIFTFVFLFQIPTFPSLKLICLHTSHVLHSCQCPYLCVPIGFMLYVIILFINVCTLDSLYAFDMQTPSSSFCTSLCYYFIHYILHLFHILVHLFILLPFSCKLKINISFTYSHYLWNGKFGAKFLIMSY